MKKTSKITCIALSVALVLGVSGCGQKKSEPAASGETKDLIKIGILQLSEHVALSSANEGFVAALKDNGYIDGETIEIDNQNAQGDQSNLKTISQRFVQNESDLILAIATPAAQAVANETSEIPVLATAVTDFVGAGIAESNEVPGGNVSGTSDLTYVEDQINLLMEMYPETKTVGIMYNSSEINSEIQAKTAEKTIADLGLESKIGTVTSTNDVAQAVESMTKKVDAIYIPTDNVFASAMATVTNIATQAKIPVIVGEGAVCELGGLATVGIDYYKLGYQTGLMAKKVLEGEDISKMPIQFSEEASVIINLDTAKALGYEFPQSVLDKAVTKYGE